MWDKEKSTSGDTVVKLHLKRKIKKIESSKRKMTNHVEENNMIND